MGTAQEDIIVNIKTVAELKQLGQLVGNLNKLKRAGVNVAGMEKNVNKRAKELGVNQKKLNTAFAGFQMEMLGILFFGMGLSKFFTGLLKPAFNLIGTFETMNLILGAAFLPTTLKINEALTEMGLKFLDLDELTREFSGDLIAVLAALTAALSLVGVFALGLGSLDKVYGAAAGSSALFFGKLILLSAVIFTLTKIMSDWNEVGDETKFLFIALTAGVGALLIKFSPITAAVLLLSGLVVALNFAWDGFKTNVETTIPFLDQIHPIFGKIAEAGKGALEVLRGLRDKFLDITGGGGNALLPSINPAIFTNPTPAGQGFGAGGGTTTNAVEVTNNFNISGMVDTAGIQAQVDEIARQINESIHKELASTARR